MSARDWSRTSTYLRTLDPEPSASTNSATRASKKRANVIRPLSPVNQESVQVITNFDL
jgi:hypothetical protein